MPQSLQLVTTADGSHTLSLPDGKVMYHSRHGAIQESSHVYIQTGLLPALRHFKTPELRVFELGFGTGLNALLTAVTAQQEGRKVLYHTIEASPVSAALQGALNYGKVTGQELLWSQICTCPWQDWTAISPYFSLFKEENNFLSASLQPAYHLIYFDAFSPEENPDLWTTEVFETLFRQMEPGGFLVTYCSKSTIRKAMQAAGWQVKKVPGPYGKREIVRACRLTG